MRRVLLLALLVAGQPVFASEWLGFYAASPAPEIAGRAPAGDAPGICVRAILAAQERYGIPDNILLGIGLQEAGRTHEGQLTVWPWSVNAAGEGRMFATRDAAMTWVRERQAAGVRSIDVGCMQINLRWHPEAFASLAEGFSPEASADYAARFLLDLRRQTGSWALAAGSYHSFTPEKRDIYLASLRKNVAVANKRIGALRDLARGAGAPRPVEVARAETTPAPAGGSFWTASLSGGSGGVRSLYSSQDLQPVLPQFMIAR